MRTCPLATKSELKGSKQVIASTRFCSRAANIVDAGISVKRIFVASAPCCAIQARADKERRSCKPVTAIVRFSRSFAARTGESSSTSIRAIGALLSYRGSGDELIGMPWRATSSESAFEKPIRVSPATTATARGCRLATAFKVTANPAFEVFPGASRSRTRRVDRGSEPDGHGQRRSRGRGCRRQAMLVPPRTARGPFGQWFRAPMPWFVGTPSNTPTCLRKERGEKRPIERRSSVDLALVVAVASATLPVVAQRPRRRSLPWWRDRELLPFFWAMQQGCCKAGLAVTTIPATSGAMGMTAFGIPRTSAL